MIFQRQHWDNVVQKTNCDIFLKISLLFRNRGSTAVSFG